ncbi:MAG: hypothetical protein ABTD50_16485 [Polyangiaceae bacterium]|jgi:hypothetical protein
MSGILRFITPSDVHDFKVQMDPRFRSVDRDVSGCSTLPDATRESWDEFYKSWRDFFVEDESWLHTAAQMDRAQAYEEQLTDWQKRLEGYHCSLSAPIVAPESERTAVHWTSALRWAGLAAGVVTAIWMIRELRG